jgi:hypothetical protein
MKPRLSKAALTALVSLLVSQNVGRAGVLDFLGLGSKSTDTAAVPAAVGALSQDQVVEGLKEALSKGVQHAVSRLGHDGGFLTNLDVKIPMPEKLQTVEKTLRAIHQDKLVDEFIDTMNHAAEQAVPEAAGVFGDAVKMMSMADAKAILIGTNNAATQYFRATTETNLFEKFLPIVKKATDQTGVTSAYKRVMGKAGSDSSFGALGSFGQSLLGPEAIDVDRYVTNKALDGLFKMVADEERSIRENPVARTSDLLQKVFGAVTK